MDAEVYTIKSSPNTDVLKRSTSKEELAKITLNAAEKENIRAYLRKLKDPKDRELWGRCNNHPDRAALLPDRVKRLILNRVLDRKAEELPSDAEIQQFTLLLETSPSVEVNDEKQRVITYSNFELLFQKLLRDAPRLQAIIPASPLFAQSPADLDEYGRLGTDLIVNFVTLKCSLLRQRIRLARYDLDCVGYLTQNQLVSYLQNDVIPQIESVRYLDRDLLHSYTRTVILMFDFFLDAKHTGRYRISDILTSGFVENIYALPDIMDSYDENGRVPLVLESWFSPERTQAIVGSFQSYDKTSRGYLTREDFLDVADGSFTSSFVDRLFQVHVKRAGKLMSLSEFTTFEIAHEHMQHPSSIVYFFKVLDLDGRGYLTRFDLLYFYEDLKASYDAYFMGGEMMPGFDDLCDQLFDMAQPKTGGRITLMDLLECKQAHDFVHSLINFIEFYRLETREEAIEMDTIMGEEEGEGAVAEQQPEWGPPTTSGSNAVELLPRAAAS